MFEEHTPSQVNTRPVHPHHWEHQYTLNMRNRPEGNNQSDFFTMDDSSRKRFRNEETDLHYSPLTPFQLGTYGTTEKNQNWIQCEGCDTWRHLPDSVDMTALPEKWYLSFTRI